MNELKTERMISTQWRIVCGACNKNKGSVKLKREQPAEKWRAVSHAA